MARLSVNLLLIILSISLSSCDFFEKSSSKHKPLEIVWMTLLKPHNEPHGLRGLRPSLHNNNDLLVSLSNNVYVLNALNGELKQVIDVGSNVTTRDFLVDEEHIYIETVWELFALKRSDYSIAWQITLPYQFERQSSILRKGTMDAQYLYVGIRGTIVKVNKSNGEIVKEYPVTDEFGNRLFALPINIELRNNRLYGGILIGGGNISLRSKIECLDMDTDEKVFSTLIPSQVQYPNGDMHDFDNDIQHMEFIGQSLIVLTRGELIKINPSTGEVVQRRVFGGPGSNPEIHPSFFGVPFANDLKNIYLNGYNRGDLIAVDVESFDISWRKNMRFGGSDTPVISSNKLYVLSSGALHVLDVSTQQPLGSIFSGQNNGRLITRVELSKDFIYSYNSREVYCLRNFK